jgi:hypothetical protein
MLTSDQLAAYSRDGFLIVDGLFEPATIDAARAACERLFYGKSYADWLAEDAHHALPGSVPDGVAPMPGGRRSRWPTGDERLDRLIENAGLLATAAALLGEQPFFCAGITFVRAGPTDTRHPAHPHEGWHIDHFNNSLLPPSPTFERHDYVNATVFLHDVDTDGAPILFLPGTHRRANEFLTTEAASGNWTEGTIHDLRRLPGLPAAIPATARAGAVLFYSSFVLHAAQPFADRRRQRILWTLSLGRRSNAAWCRHDNPFGFDHREGTRQALAMTTASVRTLLGWPPPGDPYYTPATLAALARSYPGIDLDPYRPEAADTTP